MGVVRLKCGRCDDVAAIAVLLQLDASQGYAMAGALGVARLGFAQAGAAWRCGLAVGDEALGPGAHFVGGIGEQAADGSGARTGQVVGGGEGSEQQVQFLLGQIGVARAQAANLAEQRRRPLSLAAALRRGRTGHEGGQITAFGAQLGSPRIERAAADVEGFAGGCRAVALPELQNLPSALGIGAIMSQRRA